MADRWFCSDHHLDHENIIRFSGRPFSNVREMNNMLRELHNKYVKHNDDVTFLGDVTLRRGGQAEQEWFIKELRRWNGHKFLHLGNHDHFGTRTYLDAGFRHIFSTWRDQFDILYSHFPLHPSSIGGVLANVHGHIHTNSSPPPAMWVDKSQQVHTVPYVNICVEVTDYRPINFDELIVRIREAKACVKDIRETL